MSVHHTPYDRVLDLLLVSSPAVSMLGLVSLAVTVAIGFEEPNRTMLVASAGLLLAAPLAVVTHVALTHHLTRVRRRTWLGAFMGPRAISAMSDYLHLSRCWSASRRAVRGHRQAERAVEQ